MMPSVMISDMGMVSPMMMVLRKLLRKMNKMMIANIAPWMALDATLSTER